MANINILNYRFLIVFNMFITNIGEKRTIFLQRILGIGVFFLFIIAAGGLVQANTNLPQSDVDGYGYFKVTSIPENGELIFDGQSYGNTPALIKVASDSTPSHQVIIKMEGYEDYYQDISYNPDSGQTVSINLDASHTLNNIIEFLDSQ
jgi:hypothetical protein